MRQFNKLLALVLAVCTVLTVCVMSANASSIQDGSATCTVAPAPIHYYLKTTSGTSLMGAGFCYTTNDGLTGPAYCIDYGLLYANRTYPITGKYTTSPPTAGAFANGYPQRALSDFITLNPGDAAVLTGLTEDEYRYATQVAVWATLGQLGVEGTAFTAGREYIAEPTGDSRQMRVFRAAQIILDNAQWWDRVYETGMYIRLSEDALGGNLAIPSDMTLEFAAQNGRYGIKREVINGVSYYTKEYIFASATSTYPQGYTIDIWLEGAPSGTIFTDLSNTQLPRSSWQSTTTWRVPVSYRPTTLNNNASEYSGIAKLCIPVNAATGKGDITLRCGAFVTQYQLYLAYDSIATEQSYIIADPSKGTLEASAVLTWGDEQLEFSRLVISKVGGGGSPLAGATFTLTGTDGSSRTGTTDNNGVLAWDGLTPGMTYTLTETNPPAGYNAIAPMTITLAGAQTQYITIKNDAHRTLTIHKVDKQTGYSLQGASIRLEQIDGIFATVAVTDHAGNIQFNADTLPIGSYRVYEVAAPEGYELDPTVQTIHWDGKQDQAVTFRNARKPTLIIYKQDGLTAQGLPGATFDVFKNGVKITTVATDQNGLAYVRGITTGYYEVKEASAPEGYWPDDTVHGVYIDAYDPLMQDDPRIIVTNQPMPSLRIVKYDRSSLRPLAGATFRVYRDTDLLGTYITDANGEVVLSALEPGTYTVQEVAVDDDHVVDTTPQTVKLDAGRTQAVTLAFFNDLKPGFKLMKLDAQTMLPLAGATFRVSRVGGSFVHEYTTDRNGEVDLAKLEPGAYEVVEIAAPTGYLVDNAVRLIQLNAGEMAEFIFTNTAKPVLSIHKYDEFTGEPLKGASFRIARVGDKSNYTDRTTDENGAIILTGLEPGTYSVWEESAPSGYVKSEKEYHIELLPGQTAQVAISNRAMPSLRIVKYDQQSGAHMPGITFEIYKDGALLDTRQTDEKGEILLYHAEPGTYLVKEVATDPDHVINSTPQQIELEAGTGEKVLVFFNMLKPGIHLVKVDSQTLRSIPNVRFEIKRVGSSFKQECLTDTNGEVDLSRLEPGTYEIRELEAPDGYLLDNATRIIQLNAGENANFIFTNTPKPSMTIAKYDPNADHYLAGATFRVVKIEDGAHYLDRVTDTRGLITLSGLEPGIYSVTELEAPAGYVRNETEYHVELYPGWESKLVVNNDAKPDLRIVKTDAVTGATVAGATFTVKMADGRTITTEATDDNGEILLEDLDPGVVEVWEQFAPYGYLLDEGHQHITLVPNKTGTVRFQNYPKPGLTVHKADSVTGAPIRGVKFHVVYASNNTFTGEINDLGYYYTDDTGEINLSKLQDGWYRVTEVEPAHGYAIKEPASQDVFVQAGTGKVVTFENTPLSALVVWKYDSVYGTAVEGAVFQVRYLTGTSGTGGTVIGTYRTSKNGSFTVTGLNAGTYIVEEIAADDGHVLDTTPQTVYISGKDQDIVQLFFGNAPKGSLTVTKVDSASGAPLSDVEFLVAKADGTYYGNDNGKYKTDSKGIFTIDGIIPGTTLVVKETRAKDGYILDDAAQVVTIQAGKNATLEFRNQPKGCLLVTKLDSTTRKPLSGATFRISSSSGTFVANQGGVISSNGLYTTDKNGQIMISGLEPGTYVVTETRAPYGYELDATPQAVMVNANDTQTLYFYDDPIPTGSLRIVKLDESTRQPISNVEFSVTQIDGRRMGTYRTNSKGIIILDNLTPGWYTVTETYAAKGYKLDAQPRDIQVRDGETATLEITNRQTGSALIHKVDSVTGKGIYGVSFLVCDGKGNPIGQYTSDQDGYVYIDHDLADGKYTIRELQTAEGYVLDTTVKTFYVEYGGCTTITWENTPKQGQLQVYKYAAESNPITGSPAGTPLEGAVYEISEARSGSVVDYITTDARGVAASRLLPLGRYKIREVAAPVYWEVNTTIYDETLEYAGQIIKIFACDRPVSLGVSVIKRGNAEALAGSEMRYDISIANTSSVPLEGFFWHDRIPVNMAKVTTMTTGTYNAYLNYRILYKTNMSLDYQILASNLTTSNNYSFALDAMPMQCGEVITDVYFDFGMVPAGFQSVVESTLSVAIYSNTINGDQMVNRAEVGGRYQAMWQMKQASWMTLIRVLGPAHTLPQTGY